MSYSSLSTHQSEILQSILFGKSKPLARSVITPADLHRHKVDARPVTEKLIKKYVKYFKGDADEIRSICYGAALDAVVKYSDKPAAEVYSIAVRIMINRILNASKALNRTKKRGSEYRHVNLGVGASVVRAWEDALEAGSPDIDPKKFSALTGQDGSPLDRAIAVQETEHAFGSVEAAAKMVHGK